MVLRTSLLISPLFWPCMLSDDDVDVHRPDAVFWWLHGCWFLLFSVVVQVLCSYSTLPLYAIVSHVSSSRMHTYVIIILVCVCVSHSDDCVKQMCCQMGSSFKSAVFADDVADNLRGWADGARRRVRRSATGVDASCLGTPAAAGRGWEGAAGWRLIAGRPSRPTQQPRSISF